MKNDPLASTWPDSTVIRPATCSCIRDLTITDHKLTAIQNSGRLPDTTIRNDISHQNHLTLGNGFEWTARNQKVMKIFGFKSLIAFFKKLTNPYSVGRSL